jgi:hypothetical protein
MSTRGFPSFDTIDIDNYMATDGNAKNPNAGVPIGEFMSAEWFCFIWSPELTGLQNFVVNHE